MLKSIDHINIVVSNLEESAEFFQALGFEIQHQGDLQGEWISQIVGLQDVSARYVSLELPGENTRLELIKYYSPSSLGDDEISVANKLGLRHLAFRVSNIEEVVSRLKQRGVSFLSPIQVYEPTNKKLVYLLGPDGVLLELAQYGNA